MAQAVVTLEGRIYCLVLWAEGGDYYVKINGQRIRPDVMLACTDDTGAYAWFRSLAALYQRKATQS